MSRLEGMNLGPILEATADSPEWFEVWSTVLYGSPCSLKRFSLDVGLAPFTSKVPDATASKDTGNVIFGGTGMRVESPRSQEVLLALLELVWPFDQGGLLTSNGIMRVLKYVPNLTKLTFRNLGAHIDDDVLAPIIARCCPTLTRLEFTPAFSIRTNFLLFKLMLALEKEQVEEINISHMAWVRKEMDLSILKSALQRHSWSLKIINIYQCDIVFSYVVETALSECLGLEELRLSCGGLQPSYITLEEAVEVTPWTCSRLQILDLTIEGAGLGRTLDEGAWTKLSDTEEVFAMFKRLYEQIGTLKELRCLDLRGFVESRTKHPHNYNATLPAMLSLGDQSSGRPGFLSLLGGLNKLEELRRSVYVSSEEGKATMGWPEARWMQEHWPKPRIAEFFFNDEEPTEPFKWLKDRRRTSPLELSVIDSPFRVRPRADIGAL
ncbi:hypothetical protein BGX33_002121 [Mortierella sp. NVP41]|nr:hypothetical protein BGX33_002121 [Mortierella sp. NVP41]